MTIYQFKEALQQIAKELDTTVSRREDLIKKSRTAVALSSRSIVNIHTGKIKEAAKDLTEAKDLLETLRKTAQGDLTRHLIPPETEYVEAEVIRSIAAHQPIPPPRALGVSHETYLLGLLDAVGELKRMVYDDIRRGDVDRASNLFDLMEQIYIHLSPFAIYDHVVQGFRRKLDVARSLVETTRAAVTEEVRRAEFIKNMDRLTDRNPKTRRRKG